MWSTDLHPHPMPLIPWLAALALALWAAWRESEGRRVAAGALAAALGLGLLASGWARGAAGGLEALVAAGALAVPFGVLALASRAGWRDALTMGAVGAWLGLQAGALVLLVTSLAGVLYALGYAAHRRRLAVALASTTGVARVVVWSVLGDETRPGERGVRLGSHELPYAPAILAGLLISGAWSVLS